MTHTPPIDVLNPNGHPSGEVLQRQVIHQKGKLHRAVQVLIFNEKGEVLIQERPKDADHYGAYWGLSVTGHIEANESSTVAAEREVLEELGLRAEDVALNHVFSYRRDAVLGADYVDCQINEVFVGFLTHPIEAIPFNPKEVTSIRFIRFQDFLKSAQNPEQLSSDALKVVPAYKDLLESFQYYMGKTLEERFRTSR